MLNLALAVLTITYPLLVYLGLSHFQPGVLAVLIAMIAVLRVSRHGQAGAFWPVAAGAGLAAYALLILWLDSETLLRLYPAVVNAALFAAFAYTLYHPPSAIERMSRAAGMAVSAAGVRYTRKLTGVWCLFFVVNGSVALISAVAASRELWALYNGLIAYVAMGLLFAAEFLYRRRYRRLHDG